MRCLAFTLNFAGYEGEIMRGAFLSSVPKGELEAARAYGMSPWKVLYHESGCPAPSVTFFPTLAGGGG